MIEKKSSVVVIDNGKFGKRELKYETGELAQQAAGSATVYLNGETMILNTVAASSKPAEGYDYFPLTVNVEERMYAVGKIPGSFFRREGKATTEATLAGRLIDRPLRPLFIKGLKNEVQVVSTIMSVAPDQAYDVVAINGCSMATMLSGIPFSGPVAGTRIALIDDQWVAFPTFDERENAVFEMVVAGRITESDVAIAMIEAGATENAWSLIKNGATAPTEEVVAQGLEAAKPFIKQLCEGQIELAKIAAPPVKEYPVFPEYGEDILEAVQNFAKDKLADALAIKDKQERNAAISVVSDETIEALTKNGIDEERVGEISKAISSVSKEIVRTNILSGKPRIDGRDTKTIRQLTAKVDVVPRAHGSALFQRGETQVLGVTTLNMLKMEQMFDSLSPVNTKRYIHHYNFPPYSVGETGRVGAPNRREIGHGALAERALVPVIPSRDEFPYAIRQVSEAIGSNGSTSMGSVCASTLALQAAGVPIKAPIAGIAMGLISGIDENGKEQFVTLTDILGDEDAFGDMDFKVAGTKDFVTALQLDTKLDGIPSDVLAAALKQAKDARLQILDVLNGAISEPNSETNKYAPRIETVKVPVDKIGEIIGPKGKTIQDIQEKTGAELSIEDDGSVFISSAEGTEPVKLAKKLIDEIANPYVPVVGDVFTGKVANNAAFGSFVSLTPTTDGLLHITQIRKMFGGEHIDNIDDILPEGTEIEVKIDSVDARGKVSLVPVGTFGGGKGENGGKHNDNGGQNHHNGGKPNRKRTVKQ